MPGVHYLLKVKQHSSVLLQLCFYNGNMQSNFFSTVKTMFLIPEKLRRSSMAVFLKL